MKAPYTEPAGYHALRSRAKRCAAFLEAPGWVEGARNKCRTLRHAPIRHSGNNQRT
jgi:hypothetical protein